MREGNSSNSSLQRREHFEAPNFQWREKLGLRIQIDWSEKEEEFDRLFVMKKNVATKNLLDDEEKGFRDLSEKDQWVREWEVKTEEDKIFLKY
jgi:hypothetical protein